MAKRHGRIEAVENGDGTFFLRIKAANGRTLAHTEQLTGRQVARAKAAIIRAVIEHAEAELEENR